jgi:DNA polymerase-4
MSQTIIHCDADCFFAAIEMRDQPELAHRAIAIGGRPEQRGVIATCNYAARQFGVRSAMASGYALRLCPGLLILPHRLPVYRDTSKAMMQIFSEHSEQVEPLSLDEAYLDVTPQVRQGHSALDIAQQIRQQVSTELGITVSAGIAENKFLAKVASDWRKPDGLFAVTHPATFAAQLPVQAIPGVGQVTAEKLAQLGIKQCADLLPYTETALCQQFGRFGSRLYYFCRGIDTRPVRSTRVRKSVSAEQTFNTDMPASDACRRYLPALIQRLNARIAKIEGDYLLGKSFVKLKFADFSITTLERDCAAELPTLTALIHEAANRHEGDIRLLGIGVRLLQPAPTDTSQPPDQQTLF